jgi:branched-chain amino acid transport system permease protein
LSSSLVLASLYALVAIGLNLVYGTMRLLNVAHGELVMYGMYAGVIASKNFGVDPLLILPLSFVAMALIGSLQYQVVFRRFVGQATLQQLLAAIGCALVFQMIAQMIFGADTRTATSVFSGQYVVFGPFFFSMSQIVAFAIAVIATVLVEALLRTTTWGKAVRAVADDMETAELVGVNASYINIGAFALSAGLAGLAGTVRSPISRPIHRSVFR